MGEPKGKLGVDYAEVTIVDFSDILGTTLPGEDGTVHLGQLFSRITACGKSLGDMLMSKRFYVTCKECVAELVYRNAHPEASSSPFGVVTHKEEGKEKKGTRLTKGG